MSERPTLSRDDIEAVAERCVGLCLAVVGAIWIAVGVSRTAFSFGYVVLDKADAPVWAWAALLAAFGVLFANALWLGFAVFNRCSVEACRILSKRRDGVRDANARLRSEIASLSGELGAKERALNEALNELRGQERR